MAQAYWHGGGRPPRRPGVGHHHKGMGRTIHRFRFAEVDRARAMASKPWAEPGILRP